MKNFCTSVYEIVLRIPKGKVTTYGAIAAYLGNVRLSRAVGNALHNNPFPDTIPCHRVVNRTGKSAPSYAFGGSDEQRKRLESEGVRFEDGKVDLKKFMWIP